MPLGGLAAGEEPTGAADRELAKEAGLQRSQVELMAEDPEWGAYELDREKCVKAYLYDPSDDNKGPSWEPEAQPGGRELRSHLPAAASRETPFRDFSAPG